MFPRASMNLRARRVSRARELQIEFPRPRVADRPKRILKKKSTSFSLKRGIYENITKQIYTSYVR